MPKFAANLSMLFTEAPFMERFALARQAGFTAIEYLFPYDYAAQDLAASLKQHGLKQVLFNLPAGNWGAGERGIAANPERVDEFRAGVAESIEYALALGVERLNCLAGKKLPQYSGEEQYNVLVDNVRFAASELAKYNLKLVIEQINPFDIPDFFLTRTEQVIKVIDAVQMDNVFVQYDIYHAQRVKGELTATLKKYINKIGHIQIADNPGRHQPGTGEINYPFLFQEIDKLGYGGYIGLEYIPSPNTFASLDWIKAYGYAR